MLKQKYILSSLLSLGLLLTMAEISFAQAPMHTAKQQTIFEQIEQPLSNKIFVTLTGLALIGLELWWFLNNENKGSN
jgi:plastocyanin domain-containing protein